MGRYSKSHSNYVLRKRYMNAAGGVIYERDWLTGNARFTIAGTLCFPTTVASTR